MRQAVLFFAATVAALVVPNEAGKQQVAFSDNQQHQNTVDDHNAVQAWWDTIPDGHRLFSSLEDRISKSGKHSSKFDTFIARVTGGDFAKDKGEEEGHAGPPRHHRRPPSGNWDHFPPWPHHPHQPGEGHGPHGPHGDPEKTLYELIKESKHTTKFAKLIEEHDEIKQLLQDTKHNHTVFVPTDRAFKHLPHHKHRKHDIENDEDHDHHHKPSKEFILAVLKYHITPGLFPTHRIRTSGTIPTTLHTTALDSSSSSIASRSQSQPQRIRTFTTPLIPLTHLNFHARLGPSNFIAQNGLIHAIDSLLIPPPSQLTLLRLLPGQFSTLSLALESTGLAGELDKERESRAGGATVFAPTNAAWKGLGARANAFLFSERGRRYLKALVKYHVVVNETLYSDVLYRGDRGSSTESDGNGKGGSLGGGHGGHGHGGGKEYKHVDLPSLLHGKPISVDVKHWKGFVSIVVNGFVKVNVRDAVADDGVVHVIGKVLIPPHGHHDHDREEGENDSSEDRDEADWERENEEISVEELKSRLEPYLEEEKTENRQEELGDL